jgi:anti-sigma regulatory factor (Ser/Thr protein kinase)
MARRTDEIRGAILREVFWRRASPVSKVAAAFGITREAVRLHVRAMVLAGQLVAHGTKRFRRYTLAIGPRVAGRYALDGGISEDHVWKQSVAPLLADLTQDERDICHYGLTEMVNNAIDHSGGKAALVRAWRTAASIVIQISDDGRGIFHKIAEALNLTDPRQSLLELSKGKFTTDPKRHTGEGIFFASRMFDRYRIQSDDLLFHHSTQTDDWLLDIEDKSFHGTRVSMALALPSKTVMKEVFDRFSSGPEDYRFDKTHVPLKLATLDDEALLSRSSAKRVLSRVDRFHEVLLDFAGIRSIGQAFADEIFRVFASAHPSVQLIAINANAAVTAMVRRAEAARREQES